MPSLRSELQALTARFAESIVAAIRLASIEDLLAESSRASAGHRGRARPAARRAVTDRAVTAIIDTAMAEAKAKGRGGRLARRSAADIARTLDRVVGAIRATKGKGLRAEEIRAALKLDRREMPRVLREGLQTKKLRSTGAKRATRYFVR